MLKKLFGAITREEATTDITGTRVLVVAISVTELGPSISEAKEDHVILSKTYKSATFKRFSKPSELLSHVKQQPYDYCHLHVDLDENWQLASGEGKSSLDQLLNELVQSGVKWLWVASAYKFEKFDIAPRPPRGCHFILTGQRNAFGKFLGELLDLMASGNSLPIAWVTIAPQHAAAQRDDLPMCLMVPGLGQTKFLP